MEENRVKIRKEKEGDRLNLGVEVREGKERTGEGWDGTRGEW
jgi:hypothetical protein